MTRVLLTGASGMVGTALLETPPPHLEIFALSRQDPPASSSPGLHWLKGDLLDLSMLRSLLKEVRPTHLIHGAWFVGHKEFWASSLNIDFMMATAFLWRYFLEEGGERAVFLGTCAEQKEFSPPPKTPNIYGKSKALTSQLISLIQEEKGKRGTYLWGRIFHLFGPGEAPGKLVPSLLRSFLAHKPPLLENPAPVLNLIYVKNLSKLIWASLFSSEEGCRDWAQLPAFSIGELALWIHKTYFPQAPLPIFEPASSFHPPQTPELSWIKGLPILGGLWPLEDCLRDYISYMETSL